MRCYTDRTRQRDSSRERDARLRARGCSETRPQFLDGKVIPLGGPSPSVRGMMSSRGQRVFWWEVGRVGYLSGLLPLLWSWCADQPYDEGEDGASSVGPGVPAPVIGLPVLGAVPAPTSRETDPDRVKPPRANARPHPRPPGRRLDRGAGGLVRLQGRRASQARSYGRSQAIAIYSREFDIAIGRPIRIPEHEWLGDAIGDAVAALIESDPDFDAAADAYLSTEPHRSALADAFAAVRRYGPRRGSGLVE